MKCPPPKAAGFTLIELMISIALVVVLMLGITKVFSLTSQTAGATNQMSSAMRDVRGAQATLYQDFSTAVSDGSPCMLICSSRVSAFRNKADADGDRDGDPLTIDLNGNNVEGEGSLIVQGEQISPATYNSRSHRIDTVSFFSRQRLQRQTGGSSLSVNNGVAETPLMAQMSSGEAWIWYGHLNLPNNTGANQAGNPAASITTDLPGRNRLLPEAEHPPPIPTTSMRRNGFLVARQTSCAKDSIGNISDRAGTPQAFIDAIPISTLGITPLQDLAPLAHSSLASPASSLYVMQQSRFDLAATSMDDYMQRLIAWSNHPNIVPMTTAGVDKNWWAELFCAPLVRFQGNPFLTPHPTVNSPKVNAFSFAQQAPIFLQGCTQFIVEYAGDFVCQDNNPGTSVAPNLNYGQVLNVYTNPNVSTLPSPTDGQVDFVVTTDANGNRSRKIRWYGLPRDTDGLTTVAPIANTGVPDGKIPVSTLPNMMADVVPLRDVWRTPTIPPAAPYTNNAPFEKFNWTVPPSATLAVPPSPGTTTLKDFCAAGTGDYTAPGALGMGTLDSYTWPRPERPQTQDDPHYPDDRRSERETNRRTDLRICLHPSLKIAITFTVVGA